MKKRYGLTNSLDTLRLFIAKLNIELLLNRDNDLNRIQRIKAQLLKSRLQGQTILLAFGRAFEDLQDPALDLILKGFLPRAERGPSPGQQPAHSKRPADHLIYICVGHWVSLAIKLLRSALRDC
jgi:hypothetical protein